MVNLATYRDMLAQPWGKIQYDITFAQLAHLEDLTILDFGAGFGLISQFLAQKKHGYSCRTQRRHAFCG